MAVDLCLRRGREHNIVRPKGLRNEFLFGGFQHTARNEFGRCGLEDGAWHKFL